MPKAWIATILMSLLVTTTTFAQDEDANFEMEDFGIEYCKWVSILARDVMTARQQGVPMSETLPFALDQLGELPKDMIEFSYPELSKEFDDEEQAEFHSLSDSIFQEMKAPITQMVMAAYEVPSYSTEGNQRNAIGEFENTFFAGCYTEYEEVVAASIDLTEADPELREILRAASREADSFEDRLDAEVWLTDMSARLERQVRNPLERVTLLTRVHYEATRVDLPPELILAVIEVASNFDKYAVSDDGAMGLMQVMPSWKDEIGRPDDNLFRVDTNLRYGCTMLRNYLDAEDGDLRRALALYYGTLERGAYPDEVIDKLATKWFKD